MKWLGLMTALVLFALPASGAVTVTAEATRCTTSGETCPVPLAITFRAMDSGGTNRGATCTGAECDNDVLTNEAWHDCLYEWDFGDPGDGTWTPSGADRNLEQGPVAIHVFDEAATDDDEHVVTLTATCGGESDTDTVSIFTDTQATVWPDGVSRCISNNGNFTGCPAEITDRITSVSDDFGAELVTALASGHKRILFEAGGTFSHSTVPEFQQNDGPGLVGSYGTANSGRVTINSLGSSLSIIGLNVNPGGCSPGCDTADWRYVDLEILQDLGGGNSTILSREGGGGMVTTDILWYRIKRLDGGNALLDVHEQAVGGYGSNRTYVVDSELGSDVNNWNTVFLATKLGGLVGNTLGPGYHIIRIQPVFQDMVISHNDLICCGSQDATVRGNPASVSDFLVMRQNIIRTGSSPNGFGIWPRSNSFDERIQDVIVDGNRFEAGNSIQLAVKRATVRNNIMNGSYIAPSGGHANALPIGWISEIRIFNNSGYGTSTLIQPSLAPTPITIWTPSTWIYRNNLHWFDNAGPQVYALNGAETVSNNADRDGQDGIPAFNANSPYAATTPGIAPEDYILSGAGSATAIDAGTAISASKLDYYDEVRPQGAAYDVGAIESGGATPPPSCTLSMDKAVYTTAEQPVGTMTPSAGCTGLTAGRIDCAIPTLNPPRVLATNPFTSATCPTLVVGSGSPSWRAECSEGTVVCLSSPIDVIEPSPTFVICGVVPQTGRVVDTSYLLTCTATGFTPTGWMCDLGVGGGFDTADADGIITVPAFTDDGTKTVGCEATDGVDTESDTTQITVRTPTITGWAFPSIISTIDQPVLGGGAIDFPTASVLTWSADCDGNGSYEFPDPNDDGIIVCPLTLGAGVWGLGLSATDGTYSDVSPTITVIVNDLDPDVTPPPPVLGPEGTVTVPAGGVWFIR